VEDEEVFFVEEVDEVFFVEDDVFFVELDVFFTDEAEEVFVEDEAFVVEEVFFEEEEDLVEDVFVDIVGVPDFAELVETGFVELDCEELAETGLPTF
jgi:hypothetical protein